MLTRVWKSLSLAAICAAVCLPALAQSTAPAGGTGAAATADSVPGVSVSREYRIVVGDILKVSVFQNPDLTKDAQVSDDGTISLPLIGLVKVGGVEVVDAEKLIAQLLRDGGFIVAPHVSISMVQARGNLVTVLGLVAKPGRFALSPSDNRVTDILALAGGISPTGDDIVVLTGIRDGKPLRREIDLRQISMTSDTSSNVQLQAGDMLYVNRAPNFFIYGEVQKPGAFRLERGMTVMQALAQAGGLTPKGTRRGMTIHRSTGTGSTMVIDAALDAEVVANDVIYVKESLF